MCYLHSSTASETKTAHPKYNLQILLCGKAISTSLGRWNTFRMLPGIPHAVIWEPAPNSPNHAVPGLDPLFTTTKNCSAARSLGRPLRNHPSCPIHQSMKIFKISDASQNTKNSWQHFIEINSLLITPQTSF